MSADPTTNAEHTAQATSSASSAGTPQQTTEQLLQELVKLIHQVNQTEAASLSGSAKWIQRLQSATEAIKNYWVWVPIIGFLVAWAVYRFNPFYVFDQYKIASDESAAKIAAMEQKKHVLNYYLNLGNSLLSAGKSKDAAKAFEEAKKIDPFSLEAEYGYRKTTLLSFSEEKQFDPVVAKARLAEVEALVPKGSSADKDPHIVYAKARLLWETDPSKAEEVKNLLLKMQPVYAKHSAALGLLGDIALSEGDIEAAVKHLEGAQKLLPNQWEVVNNLAYAHQLLADNAYRNNEIEKGRKALTEKAWPLYQRTINLDAELITPRIEVIRLKALLNMATGHRDLNVDHLIAQIESKKLQDLEKNKEEIFYTFVDAQNNERSPSIYSWEAKKAYLHQLQWLADCFYETKQQDKKILRAELEKIQHTSIDGKLNLPWFLWNDLNTLKLYQSESEWIKTEAVARKYALLMSVAKPE